MCHDNRSPHAATNPTRTHWRTGSPSPRIAESTATSVSPIPQAVSTTETRPARTAVKAVTVITSAAATNPAPRTSR